MVEILGKHSQGAAATVSADQPTAGARALATDSATNKSVAYQAPAKWGPDYENLRVPELTIHPVVAQPTGSSHDTERSPSLSPTGTIVPSGRPEAPENPEDYDEDDYEMAEHEEPICR